MLQVSYKCVTSVTSVLQVCYKCVTSELQVLQVCYKCYKLQGQILQGVTSELPPPIPRLPHFHLRRVPVPTLDAATVQLCHLEKGKLRKEPGGRVYEGRS